MYTIGIIPLLCISTVWSWECPTDHVLLKNTLLEAAGTVQQNHRNDIWEGIRLHIELLDIQLTDSLRSELISNLIPYVQDWYQQKLMLKRLTENLFISEDTCNYDIPQYHRISGVPADLVVYVQALPKENQIWTAKAQICQIEDGEMQIPLAGMFEINTLKYVYLTYEEKQALFIHQIAHILNLPELLHDKHSKSDEEMSRSDAFILLRQDESEEIPSDCGNNYEYSEEDRRCVVTQCENSCVECDRYDATLCKTSNECKEYFTEGDFKAYVLASLDEMYIDLSRDVEIKKDFECSMIFLDQDLEKLGRNTRCQMMNSKRIQVILGYEATIIDQTIDLKPDLLYTITGICTDLPSHIQISLTIPESVPKPKAVITAPITFSIVCGEENLVISGTESTGDLNRGLFYSWELIQNSNPNLPSFSKFSKDQATISIPVEKLKGSDLQVILRVKDHYSFTDASIQTIQIFSTPAPTIMISSLLSNTLSEVTPLVYNDCGIHSDLEFTWKLIDSNGGIITFIPYTLSPDSTYTLEVTWRLGSSAGSTSLLINTVSDQTQQLKLPEISDPFNWAIFSQSIYGADAGGGDDCDDNLGPIWIMLAWTVFMLLLTLIAFILTMRPKKEKVYSPLPPGTERHERELEVHEEGDQRIVEVIERDRRVVNEHWIFGQKFWQYHLTFGICSRYDRHPALRLLTLTTIIMVEFCIFGILYYEIGDAEFEGDDEDDVFYEYGDDIGYIFSAVGITFAYLLLMMTLLAIFDHTKKRVLPIVLVTLLTIPLLAAAIVGISILDGAKFCGRAENEWSLSIIWIFLIEVLIMESLVALLFTLFSCCRKSGKRRRAKREEMRRQKDLARV